MDEIESGGGIGRNIGRLGAGVEGCPEMGTRAEVGGTVVVVFTSDALGLGEVLLPAVPLGGVPEATSVGGEGLRGGVGLGVVSMLERIGVTLATPVFVVQAPGTGVVPNVAW